MAAQFSQRWLRGYVGSKLRRDPVYPAAYELFSGSDEPILDVGCGVGLLAFYLRERGCRQPILGLDVDARKIRQGMRIAQQRYRDVDLRTQDIQGPTPGFFRHDCSFRCAPLSAARTTDGVAYRISPDASRPAGLLVIRDCPRDNGPRFWMTWAAEKFAQAVSWNLNTSLHFPSRERINGAFSEIEFERESRPLWGTSPFNNYLFIFRRRAVLELCPVGGMTQR